LRGVNSGALQGADLEVKSGEIVGLAGVDGNGQRELFEALAGLATIEAGEMTLPPQGERAFVPPDRNSGGLILSFDVTENLCLSPALRRPFRRGLSFDWKKAQGRARALMEQFDVRAPATGSGGLERTLCSRLSGGNAQKIVLARALAGNPALVVAVDPTRGLDVGATSAVRNRLKAAAQNGAAVLLISTDLDEVLELSHRLGVFYEGHIVPQGLLPAGVSRTQIGALMAGSAQGPASAA
jgi:simple sugar transport system ATP-binding protein